MFQPYGHHQVRTVIGSCIAQPLHLQLFIVGTFCVVGLVHWGVKLPYTSHHLLFRLRNSTNV
jgi:hypothetical protein